MYKKLFAILLAFAMMFSLKVISVMAQECDDCPPPQILAAGWVYFEFPGPGSVHTVNYSNAEPVDLRVGSRDCCILDDIVEKYVDGCLIGTHRSIDGIQTQYDWISLQPGNHVIELVNTSSQIHASGWYYDLTAFDYSGQYAPCELPLETEWIYPNSAWMGRNYNIILRVHNPNDTSQTLGFSLGETMATPDLVISWPLEEEREWKLDGQEYSGEYIEREIGLDQTMDFIFTLNHDWNWIEPWGVSRFLGIAKSLVLSIPGLEELSLTITLAETMLTYIEHVGEIRYDYEGIGNSESTGFDITVSVPDTKKLGFGGSVLTGVAAGKATSAGLVALGTVVGAKVAAALFIVEAVLIAGAEVEYALAADPVTDFTEIALPEPVPIPESCIPELAEATVAADVSSQLLGTLLAMYESYVRYEAAEDAGSLEWMAIQLGLAQRYAAEAAGIVNVLELLADDLVSPISVPTGSEIEQIRQDLAESGLPETEQCVLAALGYTTEAVEEIEASTIEFPEDYFVNFPHLPTTLGVSGEGLATLSGSLPPLPEGAAIATVDFDPDTLNKKSKGRWVTIYVELPEGHNVGDIDCSRLRLMGDIAPAWCDSSVGDYDKDGIADLMVKFDRETVIEALDIGDQGLPVVGVLESGVVVAGTDIIRVIEP